MYDRKVSKALKMNKLLSLNEKDKAFKVLMEVAVITSDPVL